MYDENDGFFDHVPPPVPPSSNAQGKSTVPITNEIFEGSSEYPAGPYGLGQRVPMVVISPWSKGGYVNSEVFDHTSLIQFVEKRFGVKEPNITKWRRAVTGDLTSAFNFTSPNDATVPLPSTVAYIPPDNQRHPDYVPTLSALCEEHEVGAVLPLTDLDIEVLARAREVGRLPALVPSAEVAHATYDKYETRNPVARKLVERFLHELDAQVRWSAAASVLDVGCGEGIGTVRMADVLPEARVVGIDVKRMGLLAFVLGGALGAWPACCSDPFARSRSTPTWLWSSTVLPPRSSAA